MISGKTQVAATVAVLALSMGSASAAPADVNYDLVSRGAAMSKVSRVGGGVAKDIAHSVLTDEAHKKLNEHINPPHHVHPGLQEAARIATKPHDPKIVEAATSHVKSHKKRELEAMIEELFARGAAMSKVSRVGGGVAKDLAHSVLTDEAHKKLNEHINPPHHVHPGLQEAARLATKPHDPKLVEAATSHVKSHKKRELEAMIDELFARGAAMSKVSRVGGGVAKDIAHSVLTDEAHKKLNEHISPPHHVHPGLQEAARIATKPHDPKIVEAATSHVKSHKKRELEAMIDELFARGAAMSKVSRVGGGVAKDLAHSVLTDEAHKKLNEHINPPHPVHPGLQEAARLATKPHDHKIVEAATSHVKSHKKRELEAMIDELFARGAAMSKVSRVGGGVAKDIAHSVLTEEANKKLNEHLNPPRPVHPGLLEAARIANKPHDPKIVEAVTNAHKSHKKRELASLIDYLEARAFELEDLE